MRRLVTLLVAAALAPACGGRGPETRYYDLSTATRRQAPSGPVLAIEPLEADPPYDDDRIVYRENPYRVDYYHYHRWSAPPGDLVARHLEGALEASGRFAAVLRGNSEQAGLVLGGRLVALEEVDVSKQRWVARVAVELHLRDAASGDVVWSRQLEERVPVVDRSPEGVARALSRALDRIARRVAPELGSVAAARSARTGG